MNSYPSNAQLLDLFNNSSVALLITDGAGTVHLYNKATLNLFGPTPLAEPAVATRWLTPGEYMTRVNDGRPVLNMLVDTPHPGYMAASLANIGFATIIDEPLAFWAIRPVLGDVLPTAPRPDAGLVDSTAPAWIADINESNDQYTPAGDGALELIKALYDSCPVALHVIERDGTVNFANWKDEEIVGADIAPNWYVGHHIRRIYADRKVIDDFLGRWDDNSPIINFRADFLNNGQRQPVVIFSTANSTNDALANTRCFVFPDEDSAHPRDMIAALDLELS
jgi:hypothetical protein